jgi:hypothetical protein
MRFFRSSILSAGLLLAFSSVAAADSDWQTVSLDNNPDFTIDVPAVVGTDYLPEKDAEKGDLMFFATKMDGSGGMFCMLNRKDYDKELGPQQTAAALATKARDLLCASGNTDISVEESESSTSNGFPAGRCAVSYTEAGDNPGWVSTVLAVATPHAMYQLRCEVHADSQANAETYWRDTWSGQIAHIQQSLHLPASEK